MMTDDERRCEAEDIGRYQRDCARLERRRGGFAPRSSSPPIVKATPPGEASVPGADVLTEAGAAERFCRLHGDEVRFDHRRHRWLLWRDHRWLSDADAAITRLGHDFARTWQRQALDIPDSDRRERTVRFAIRLEKGQALANVLALARAFRPIADAGDHWDADAWLLGTPNGVIDLRTGALRPGRPEDRITLNTATPFDATAACPRWERFVHEIFCGDADLIAYVHRAVGYSLTGDTSEQCLFVGHGQGSNGKSTFTRTLTRLLGDLAHVTPFSTVELHERSAIPNDLAALLNRRFVTAGEANDGARFNEARLKALTGCEPVTARFLHSEFFTFQPVAKYWLSVNHKPLVRDDSHAFWRRMRLIPFLRTFSIDKGLGAALAAEAPGILAWAVRGSIAWQREGLAAPEAVVFATSDYARDQDPLNEFLDEACDVDPAAEVGAADVYLHYRAWADRHGLTERERLSSTAFGRKMGERFEGAHTRCGKVYRGLARGLPAADARAPVTSFSEAVTGSLADPPFSLKSASRREKQETAPNPSPTRHTRADARPTPPPQEADRGRL